MESHAQTAADKQLNRLANIMANPTSAPVLAKMVSRRQRHGTRIGSERLMKVNNSSCNRTHARTAVTSSKYANVTALWMNQPPLNESEDEEEYYIAETYGNQAVRNELIPNRMDLQTNNSRKEGRSPDSRPDRHDDGNDSLNDKNSSVSYDSTVIENSSALAKGADAMVKKSLSRPTEIIDTSKLIEEGKVETEYEDSPEEEDDRDHALVEDYEKSFAYSRRLRALLNMQFKELDRGSIETNFQLIKMHEHPTQKMIDRWRKVDQGQSYNDQVKRQKQIEDFKAKVLKKKSKKDSEGQPILPEMIRFTVRFRKANSDKLWDDYLEYRQKLKKQSGTKISGAVPKRNEKYLFAFMDVWSYYVMVFVKPSATVREIIEPVFARLGLERRADFTYTIGCFNNDKRAGKAKVAGIPTSPEPVEMCELATDLYKKNCTEIYVNDNRCEIFFNFPDYYNRKIVKKPGQEQSAKPNKGKAKDNKDKNGNEIPTIQSTSDNSKVSSDNGKVSKNNANEVGNWFNENRNNAAGYDDNDVQDHPANVETMSVPSVSVRTSAMAAPGTSVAVAYIGTTSSPAMVSRGSELSPPLGLRTNALLSDETVAFEESAVTSGDRHGHWLQNTAEVN